MKPPRMYQSSLDGDTVALGLDDLRQACEAGIASLKRDFGWPDDDRRIESIHRLRNVLQSCLALYAFHRTIFPRTDFWDTYFVARPSESEFENHYRECDVLLRFAALHGQFSAMEADIRAMVQALDPSACGGGLVQFDSIARWLLARANSASRFSDLLELSRLTRNTIHNNGVHRPASGRNVTIRYEQQDYAFLVDRPIEFADWLFVLKVGRGILGLLQTLARDPVVSVLARV